MIVVEANQLMDKPFRVDPAKRMVGKAKLAGTIGNDHGALKKAMDMAAAEQRALGGDLDGIGMPFELDTELVEMG